MPRTLRYFIHIFIVAAAACFLRMSEASEIANKADQIFDAARQTVTDAVGVAQGVVSQAIDAAKSTVINDIDTVQGAAKLVVNTGRGVIELGENYVLGVLGAGR